MNSKVLLDLETACAHSKGCGFQMKRSYLLVIAAATCCTFFLLVPISLTLLSSEAAIDVATVRSSHQVCVQLQCAVHVMCLHSSQLILSSAVVESGEMTHSQNSNTMQCLLENGKVENRVCSYSNLVLHGGDLLYIYEGIIPPFCISITGIARTSQPMSGTHWMCIYPTLSTNMHTY